MIQTFKQQNHHNAGFNAVFYRNGKKLNAIDQADVVNFSALIRSYVKSENPDKIRVDFKNLDNGLMIWTKTFEVDELGAEIKHASFQGLGEVEVNELVQRKFSELERQKEVEFLSRDLQVEKLRNEDLLAQVSDLQTTLEAKKQVEYYSNVIGMALPGLAKFFVDTPVGSALTYLSGTDEESKELEAGKKSTTEPPDQRQSIVHLITEFCNTLHNQELGTLYLLMIELEKDKANFSRVLHHLTQSKSPHATV
jgi:hypothetical protein